MGQVVVTVIVILAVVVVVAVVVPAVLTEDRAVRRDLDLDPHHRRRCRDDHRPDVPADVEQDAALPGVRVLGRVRRPVPDRGPGSHDACVVPGSVW